MSEKIGAIDSEQRGLLENENESEKMDACVDGYVRFKYPYLPNQLSPVAFYHFTLSFVFLVVSLRLVGLSLVFS